MLLWPIIGQPCIQDVAYLDLTHKAEIHQIVLLHTGYIAQVREDSALIHYRVSTVHTIAVLGKT